MALTDKLTAIADAIRLKTGKTDTLTLDGMASAIVDISGDTDIEDSLVTGTVTSYTNSRVKIVGGQVFHKHPVLQSVNFPACTIIAYGAFYNCTTLTTVSFPACTNIGGSAFYSCTSLTTASFPACTNISSYAFWDCTSLTTVSFPACTNIGGSAFYHCNLITTASFPACTNIGSSAFWNCTSLTTVSFPACTNISSYAFYNCRKLTSLYLAGSSICTLTNSNAFSRAGITSSTGAIYVPLSLGWSYKNATNWAYFSNVIFSIEGDEIVDPDTGGGGTGELISFIIDYDEYQAENGMNWGEWVESDYNTIGVYIDPNTSGIMLNGN